MRLAVWLVLLAGCDQTWNLDHIDEHDAAAFDPSDDCPADYDLRLVRGSRFRIAQTARTAWTASDLCNADLPGATHLAVAPTRETLDALIGALTSRGDDRWWIGAVQPTGAPTPIDSWIWVTGEPIDKLLWAAAEPNDGNGIEDNHEDQFAFIESGTPGLVDAEGLTLERALCECDGRAVAADATAAIDQSRM
jgi:hypothetical protein